MDDLTPLERALRDSRQRTANMPRDKQIIAEMWAYAQDLRLQGETFAHAKTDYGRRLSSVVVQERANGEKSATAAEHTAEASDGVYNAHLAYRRAEQMIVADREALRVLHAELDSIRTDRADERAASQWEARTAV